MPLPYNKNAAPANWQGHFLYELHKHKKSKKYLLTFATTCANILYRHIR